MGKHREKENDYDFDDVKKAVLNDFDLDANDFFEQFQPKKTRQRSKRSRNARRLIDEYQENRKLAERLSEYYDSPDN